MVCILTMLYVDECFLSLCYVMRACLTIGIIIYHIITKCATCCRSDGSRGIVVKMHFIAIVCTVHVSIKIVKHMNLNGNL